MNHKSQFAILTAIALALALVTMFAPPTIAQDPTPSSGNERSASGESPMGTQTQVTYQGRLTSASGTPINSTVQMVFKLYNDGSTLLWTSATRTVTPANGLFAVYLGAGPDPNLSSIILVNVASVGVTVGSDAEMTPRQPLNTVIGHSINSSGVIGSSSGSVGVWGNSSSNVGVYATSGGSTRTNAAIRAENTDTSTGMAGYFTNNSAYATTHFANAGTGEVLYLQNPYIGTGANGGYGGGPFINAVGANALLFQVDHVGNVSQVRDANGLVKAALYGYCSNTTSHIVRSFNNVGGTITITNGTTVGSCIIDFGFEIEDRFWVATGTYNTVACDMKSQTQLVCYTLNLTSPTKYDHHFMLLVY